jgi:RNA polymerase sigma factor (sigma-70 family)
MSNLDKFQLGPMLQRSVVGDAHALNQLLGTIRPYLHSQIRSRLGPTSGGELDESSIVQNSLLNISQNIGQLRQHSVPGLLAWVGRIVHYALIDAMRKKGRDKAELVGSHIFDLPGAPTAGDVCESAEQRMSLSAALAQLPEREQQVVKWRFFDHLSDAEISERIGGTVAAIRVLRCRALRNLKKLMETPEAI